MTETESNSESTPNGPWFQQGLRFECANSGNCCTGPSGWVCFGPEELTSMAALKNLLPFQFLEQFAHRQKGRWTLNEVERGGLRDCVFLRRDPHTQKAQCSIYAARPKQCRTWPFWPQNLRDEPSWNTAGRTCPGIANGLRGEGTLFGVSGIEERQDQSPKED